MEILNFINIYLIKYLYIIVIACLILSLVYLLIVGVKPILITLTKMLDSINCVNNDTKVIKEDLEKISYTLNNSLPLFVDIAFALIIVKSILKDFNDTKKSKRSLLKSTFKEYGNVTRKHNRKFNPEILQSILWLIKQFK